MPKYEYQPSAVSAPMLDEDLQSPGVGPQGGAGISMSSLAGVPDLRGLSSASALGNSFACELAGLGPDCGSKDVRTPASLSEDSRPPAKAGMAGLLEQLPFKISDSPFKTKPPPGYNTPFNPFKKYPASPFDKRIGIGDSPFGIEVGGSPRAPSIGFDLSIPFGKGKKAKKK